MSGPFKAVSDDHTSDGRCKYPTTCEKRLRDEDAKWSHYATSLAEQGKEWRVRAEAAEAMLTDSRPAVLLSKLVMAIYHDPTSDEWIKQAPQHVVDALIDAQQFVNVP